VLKRQCGNLKFLDRCFSQTVFFDWRIIPHTTVCKHKQIYDVTQLQQGKVFFTYTAKTSFTNIRGTAGGVK